MRNQLLLCTKKVHYIFRNNIYQQKDGVVIRSPLSPVLAGIFLVHLEETFIREIFETLGKICRKYHHLN